jgi:LmbE family N-acetylglucosaminyl deacetylase
LCHHSGLSIPAVEANVSPAIRPPWRVLVVAAHPDDIEYGCAGTVAKWTDEGAHVTYCIVTDGSTGTQDRDLVGERLAELRREESARAAAVVGVQDIEWLGYPDGYVAYSLDLRKDLARVFRRLRPHRYVVMDPASTIDGFVNHPDHRAVGQASLDVTVTAGTTPGHFPELLGEGLEPWRGLRELWIMGPGARPEASDISATIGRKVEALLCHRTQMGDEAGRIADLVREATSEAGRPHAYAHAETFQVIAQRPEQGVEEGEGGPDAGPSPGPDPAAPGGGA